jgi:hypothetical protein
MTVVVAVRNGLLLVITAWSCWLLRASLADRGTLEYAREVPELTRA